MGRYSGSTGGGSAGGAQAIINSVLPAGERIQRGDIVLVGADGKGYMAALPSESKLAQAMRPTAGGPQLVNYQLASRFTLGSSGATTGDGYEVVVLTNKNILVAAVGASAANDGRGSPAFMVLDPDGNTVITWRVMLNLTGNEFTGNVSAVALPGGGFAIAYTALNAVMLAIYDAAGVQVLPPFKVHNSYMAVRIALLANGNIAIVAATTGNSAANMVCSIYSTDGSVVKAAFTVATSSYGTWHDRIIGVAALTGGGFVVGYILGTGSSTAMACWRIYDNTGSPVGGATSLWPRDAANITCYCHIAPLPDGGFAFAAYGATVGAYLAICSAQGGLRIPLINLGVVNGTQNNAMALTVAPNGNVGAVAVTDGGTKVWLYSLADNKLIVTGKVIEPYSAAAVAVCGTMFINDDNSVCLAISMAMNPHSPKVFTFDPDFNLISAWQSDGRQISYTRAKVIGVVNSKANARAYMLFYQEIGSAIQMVSNLVVRQPMTTLGVATNNAEKDNEVGVQMTGVTTLRRSFALPWTTNQQSANPPGQRMYAAGSTAVMSGIQPAAANPIN